jgi:hypothetical protein
MYTSGSSTFESHPMLIHVHFRVHESFTAGHPPSGKSAMSPYRWWCQS